jgi:hypothetical protein
MHWMVLHRPVELAALIGSWPPEPCSLAVGEARWDELSLPPRQYFRAMAHPSIRESQLSARPWTAAQEAASLVWKKSRTWRNDNKLSGSGSRKKTIRN